MAGYIRNAVMIKKPICGRNITLNASWKKKASASWESNMEKTIDEINAELQILAATKKAQEAEELARSYGLQRTKTNREIRAGEAGQHRVSQR